MLGMRWCLWAVVCLCAVCVWWWGGVGWGGGGEGSRAHGCPAPPTAEREALMCVPRNLEAGAYPGTSYLLQRIPVPTDLLPPPSNHRTCPNPPPHPPCAPQTWASCLERPGSGGLPALRTMGTRGPTREQSSCAQPSSWCERWLPGCWVGGREACRVWSHQGCERSCRGERERRRLASVCMID